MDTAQGLVVDVCRSLARHGPRRFYILNLGLTTRPPLKAVAERLLAEGIVVRR